MSLVRPLRLLLLGAPGSGKGTQTSRLLKQFPLIQSLSSGDILRSQIAAGTDVGKLASSYIKNGQLVPDATMVSLISNQLEQNSWLNKETSWLLDGFPRTVEQAAALNGVLESADANLNLVVELDVDQKVILERIEARWVHLPSGRVYNLDYNPPKVPYKDDLTGDPLTKREDDTAEVFQRRLDKYNQEIVPLKEFYDRRGILSKVSGNTSDIIYPKLSQLLLDEFGH
ncbi:adenylate kinase 2 [Scheffersomyces xylosifermentans]|uniref:adenylate kinase 2 n=1 Tax=Scheffersomyces xylosifermentans TaxID=1304137 RepID=UPI00315CA6C2